MRDAFLLALAADPTFAYRFVELGRQELWCADECAHLVEKGIFGQSPNGDEPVEQLYARGVLAWHQMKGRIRRRAFVVGEGPQRDSQRVENERTLRSALKDHPLKIDVHRGAGVTDDGSIEWTDELDVMSADEVQNGTQPEAWLQPSWAPLEIGYTRPSRTIVHLIEHGAVWRWPYGSDRLWLCASVGIREDEWGVAELQAWPSLRHET